MCQVKIRILDILEETMADGPGFRTSIYCAGCGHHCPGCHNPQSWDKNGGEPISVEVLFKHIVDADMNVTFTGGDPMLRPEAFIELAQMIKNNTNKNIWCYTGFTYEEILSDKRLSMILPYIDTLVDGPFMADLREPELHFRGSSNQRIIHLTEQKDDAVPGTVSITPYL